MGAVSRKPWKTNMNNNTQYFEKNQSWGDGGIQEIVQNLYEINKREDILKDFLKEALQKINLKENSLNKKQLPPYSQFD